jgi:hypothetical protein
VAEPRGEEDDREQHRERADRLERPLAERWRLKRAGELR